MRWIIALIFLPLTIVLLSGRGGFLIAGYNTASEEEKKKYDEKKLCQVTGCGMGLIMVLVFVLLSFGADVPDWCVSGFGGAVFVVVAGTMLLSNTVCKVKGTEPVEKTKETKKQALRFRIGIAAVGAIILIGVGVLLTTGRISESVDANAIQIHGAYWKDYRVPMSSIKDISYTEEFEVGSRKNGMGSFKLLEGSFENEELGAYTLYAYRECKSYIKLHTGTGMVVINASTLEETRALYETIQDMRKK